MARSPSVDLRRAVLKEYGHRCIYCGVEPSETIHIDHVYPWRWGGETVRWNLVPACQDCNLHKRDRIPAWADWWERDWFDRDAGRDEAARIAAEIQAECVYLDTEPWVE